MNTQNRPDVDQRMGRVAGQCATPGDAGGVAIVYTEHRDALVRFARTLVDHATADDVVSEAFLRLLRYETIQRRELTRQYLFRVVKNLVNRERRRLASAAHRGDGPSFDGASDAAAMVNSTPAHHEPMDDADSCRSRALSASLERVRDDDFHTLMLTSVRGLSSQQAGSALELRPEVVCRRRSTVLKHLRSLLASA
jgi:RNA polymerase sigma factor (sigma-70 family)